MLETAELPSPIGTLALVASPLGLCAVDFDRDWVRLESQLERRFGPVRLEATTDPAGAVSALRRYFDGGLAGDRSDCGRHRRHAVPAAGVDHAPQHSRGPHLVLRRHGEGHRPTLRNPGGGSGERRQPGGSGGALSPRDRPKRQSHGVRRRPAPEGLAAPSRGSAPLRNAMLLPVALVMTSGLVSGARSTPQPSPLRRGNPMTNEAERGLSFRLSDGEGDAASPARPPLAPAATLDEAETERLLARLAPIAAPAEERLPFALREKSLPPPRTGKTVSGTFPPESERPAPVAVAAGPLEVLRRMPEGDVPLAPNLAVTFSEPMVAVTSHADLAARSPAPASHARAARPVALGRDEDPALRARGPIPDGHRLQGRGARGHARGRRKRHRRDRGLDVLHPGTHAPGLASRGRARATRSLALRGLRPEGGCAVRDRGPPDSRRQRGRSVPGWPPPKRSRRTKP